MFIKYYLLSEIILKLSYVEKFFQKTQYHHSNEWEAKTLERDKNQDRQFKVLNACMTGDIDIIDDYINRTSILTNLIYDTELRRRLIIFGIHSKR